MSKLSLLVSALWMACTPLQMEKLPVSANSPALSVSSSSSSTASRAAKHRGMVSYRLEEPPEIQGVLGTYCVEKKESENLSSASRMHLDQFLIEGAIHLIEEKYDTPFSRMAGFHVGRMVVPSPPKLMEKTNGEQWYCAQAFMDNFYFIRLNAPLN